MLFDQAGLEALIARDDGCMRREDGGRTNHGLRLQEAEAVPEHQPLQSSEDQKGGVPFIDVVDRRLNAQPLQRANAADPEHQLLLQSFSAVGDVEFLRDIAKLRWVLLNVRVQQDQSRLGRPLQSEQPL